jgi:hypothetical protein
MLCNLQQARNGVQPETCTYWYSLMTASKTHSKPVTVSYTDVPYTCANLPTYSSSPGPQYVMQQ